MVIEAVPKSTTFTTIIIMTTTVLSAPFHARDVVPFVHRFAAVDGHRVKAVLGAAEDERIEPLRHHAVVFEVKLLTKPCVLFDLAIIGVVAPYVEDKDLGQLDECVPLHGP